MTEGPASTANPASKPALLIVDDDPIIVDSLEFLLEEDFLVGRAATRLTAIQWLQAQPSPPPVALIDLGLPPLPHQPDEGFALISELLAGAPKMRIVVLSGQNDSANARHARALGAVEFVAKPTAPESLRQLLLRLTRLDTDISGQDGLPLLGNSPPLQKLCAQLRQYADAPFPVLIEGESGSGKELIAAALHQLSGRANAAYLTLNCAAIAPSLIEAALFGHARGAFTGAVGPRAGYFEEAAEGSLLLDEIGELPLELQPKLLRVLENGEYQRVGETQVRQSKARILAATNRDLKQEVRTGRFRADLYHRLSVFSLAAPPLRELGDDRRVLLDHFRQQFARQFGQVPFRLAADAEALWLGYAFPGNVRELRNIVIRLTTRYPGQVVGATELVEEFDPECASHLPVTATGGHALQVEQALAQLGSAGESFSLDRWLQGWESAFIEAARRLARGNMSQAAKLLGLQRTTLYHRLEVLERTRPDETSPSHTFPP